MAKVKNRVKPCTQLLLKSIENRLPLDEVVYQGFTCFAEVANDVANLAYEVYGNGTRGGLKQDILNLVQEVSLLSQQLSSIDKLLRAQTSIKSGRRGGDFPEHIDRDSFAQVVKWFVDRVLPALVISAVLAVVNLVLFVTALQNGWIHIP